MFRMALLVSAALLLEGCGSDDTSTPCASSSECDLHPFGQCTLAPSGRTWCQYGGDFAAGCDSGFRWSELAGDDLAGACFGSVTDGGVDAAPTDGGGDAADDAGSSACTWSAPVELQSVNSSTDDYGPTLSADGLTLVFARTVSAADTDLYIATRASMVQPFGVPIPAPNINTTAHEYSPELSKDGLEIFFIRFSVGNPSAIWSASRATTTASFGAPVQVVPASESPAVTGDKLTLYYFQGFDLLKISRPAVGAAWGGPTTLPATTFGGVDVSQDDLRLLLSGDEGAAIAERASTQVPFGTPVIALDYGFPTHNAEFSGTERQIYMNFSLMGQGADLYVATCVPD